MGKQIQYDISTGQETSIDVPDIELSIEELQEQKLSQLMDLYKNTIVQGFTSNTTGTPIFFTYSQQDQLNYNKIATTVALDPTNDSIQVGSDSGVVTMTRAQFLQFVQDAKTYEMGLYTKRISLENQINTAPDIPTLNGIAITL